MQLPLLPDWREMARMAALYRAATGRGNGQPISHCFAKTEAKVATSQLKRASVQYRSDIAKLRQLIGQQAKAIAHLKKQNGQPRAAEEPTNGVRFSARSVKAQRKRLGLSAEIVLAEQRNSTVFMMGYVGKRLSLTVLGEETDPEKIASICRSIDLGISEEEGKYLVGGRAEYDE